MSLRGAIEAECPNGCENFAAEVWSYIRGDRDSALRMAVLAGECNLLVCPTCGAPFFPDASYVYSEPEIELVAFVFPASYRAKEQYWRSKMREDFKAMRTALGPELPVEVEPEVFFGPDGLAELLGREDFRGEEQEVMEQFARDLSLSLYRVSPRYARERDLPRAWPCAGKTPSREALIRGLEKVVAANDRLAASARALAALKAKGAAVPPLAGVPLRS